MVQKYEVKDFAKLRQARQENARARWVRLSPEARRQAVKPANEARRRDGGESGDKETPA